MFDCFRQKGLWLKGNLHLHSTGSDGARSPLALAKLYQRHGYAFTAITDHETLSSVSETLEGFTVLSGVEVGCGLIHAVGVGLAEVPPGSWEDMPDLHRLRRTAGFSFVAHPYWSNLDLATFRLLEGFPAVEVFNAACELEIGRGFAEYAWDNALCAGLRLNAVAVDDSHQQIRDYCQGWVMVKAPVNDERAILAALKAGRYYSSSGPTLRDISRRGKTVRVRCSPCRQVRFIANTWHGAFLRGTRKRPLVEGTYTLSGDERYLRVEVVDFSGRKAWSNPAFLDG